MTRARRLPRGARWAVPAGAVAVVGLVIGGSMAASAASAAPRLPARTAAQLLADASRNPAVPSSLSGVIVEKAALGLPRLPGAADGSPASWLAGTHTVDFWYGGPGRIRLAVPSQLGESDLRQDGRQVWLWSSSANTATHLVLPQRPAGAPPAASLPPPGPLGGDVPTPEQAARQVLAAVGPSTTVSVQRNVMVAGRAAYQLAIAPKASGSLIGQIRIAVDAHGYLPLRLQVFARGAAAPAYQVAYTSLSTARPAASNFAFTPPPGAKVKTVRVPASLPGSAAFGPAGLPGAGWQGSAAGMPQRPVHASRPVSGSHPVSGKWEATLPRHGHVQRVLTLPRGTHLSHGFRLPRGFRAVHHGAPLQSGDLGQGLARAAQPRVFGKDWLSVVEFRPGAVAAAASSAGQLADGTGQMQIAGTPSPRSNRIIVRRPMPAGRPLAFGTPGAVPGWPAALLQAAQPVHGAWGSGRLLRTALVSVLMTSDGRMLIGAVTPSVLYADAAQRT